MRTLRLLLAVLLMPILAAHAQEPDAPEGARIASAQVSGLDLDRLSPGLRQDINALVGKPLDWGEVSDLAARIEAERPGVAAAVRAVRAPNDEARVVFFVARMRDPVDGGDDTANINTRYIIESVRIRGVPASAVTQELRNDLQSLVGGRLDHQAAEQLAARLRTAFPGYEISRTMSRGSRRGQLRLIFNVRKGESMRSIHFGPSKSKFLYHSDQGWSGLLDIRLGGRDVRVTPTFALGNGDDLIEEYSGYGVRVESRNVGSERLGVSLELSRFKQTWQPVTLSSLASHPEIPEAYRRRSTIAPSVTFALNPHVRVTGGVDVSELEPLSGLAESQMASALIASIGYDQRWEHQESSQNLDVSFGVRDSSDARHGDLDYTRYVGRGLYEYQWGRSTLLASGMAGRITGRAPLFERFSLGDSSTLRGWNKYDISPVGGDQMFHASLEYRNRGLAFFVDTGSVWDLDAGADVKVSTGFGFHGDNAFFTLGFPLNANDVGTTVMLGVRF